MYQDAFPLADGTQAGIETQSYTRKRRTHSGTSSAKYPIVVTSCMYAFTKVPE